MEPQPVDILNKKNVSTQCKRAGFHAPPPPPLPVPPRSTRSASCCLTHVTRSAAVGSERQRPTSPIARAPRLAAAFTALDAALARPATRETAAAVERAGSSTACLIFSSSRTASFAAAEVAVTAAAAADFAASSPPPPPLPPLPPLPAPLSNLDLEKKPGKKERKAETRREEKKKKT